MRPLVVVGAGGLGREVAAAVQAINAVTPAWKLLGFVDDDRSLQGTEVAGAPVLGPIDDAAGFDGAALVVSTGRPGNYRSRKAIVERLGLPPSRYATIVHPSAVLGRGTHLGPGCIVLALVVTTADVRIGAHVALMPSCVLTHDDVVGDYCTFGAGVRLAGRVRVDEGAYVGAGALVREERAIGAWSLVGMGAVVTKDVPDGEVWAGVPARCRGPAPGSALP